MKFHSLKPFIPSGKDFEGSKQLFAALGFEQTWDAGDYVGFERDGSAFILQRFEDRAFAENLMITVNVDSIEAFRDFISDKQLAERFGVRIGEICQQPYGKELNIIDIAGVCWHFVE